MSTHVNTLVCKCRLGVFARPKQNGKGSQRRTLSERFVKLLMVGTPLALQTTWGSVTMNNLRSPPDTSCPGRVSLVTERLRGWISSLTRTDVKPTKLYYSLFLKNCDSNVSKRCGFMRFRTIGNMP